MRANPLVTEVLTGLNRPGKAQFDYLGMLLLQAVVVFVWWPKDGIAHALQSQHGPRTLLALVMAVGVTTAYFALRAGAVVVTVTTAAIVASDLAKLHRRANDLGPERSVVVARHDLALGTTISADDLRERRVHSSQLPTGALADVQRAVGRVVTVPLVEGAFVAGRNLAPRR